MENWKDIDGYEGLYEVSDTGRVRRLATNRLLKPGYDGRGYRRVKLCKDGLTKDFLVHRLVAKAFVPNPMNKPCVNHLDEDRANNAASNLEWCTVAENDNYGTRNERMAKTKKAKARKALKAKPVDVEKVLREVDELLAELDRKSHGQF